MIIWWFPTSSSSSASRYGGANPSRIGEAVGALYQSFCIYDHTPDSRHTCQPFEHAKMLERCLFIIELRMRFEINLEFFDLFVMYLMHLVRILERIWD